MSIQEVTLSVSRNKCPHCLKGDFFIYRNVYSFSKFDKMNNKCPECSMDFRQEPGFYLGAAIMSYVIQVVLVFAFYPLFMLGLGLEAEQYIFVAAGILILLAPVTYRLARLLWINMLGKRPA